MGIGDEGGVQFSETLANEQNYYTVDSYVENDTLVVSAFNAFNFQYELFWGSDPQQLNHLTLDSGLVFTDSIFGGSRHRLFPTGNMTATVIGETNAAQLVALDVDLQSGEFSDRVLANVTPPPEFDVQYGSESFGMNLKGTLGYTHQDGGLVYQTFYNPAEDFVFNTCIGDNKGSPLANMSGAPMGSNRFALGWPNRIVGLEIDQTAEGFEAFKFGELRIPFEGGIGLFEDDGFPSDIIMGNYMAEFSYAPIDLRNIRTIPQAPTGLTELQISNRDDSSLRLDYVFRNPDGALIVQDQLGVPPYGTEVIEPGKDLPVSPAHGIVAGWGDFSVQGTWDIGGAVAVLSVADAPVWNFSVRQEGSRRMGVSLSNRDDHEVNCEFWLWDQTGDLAGFDSMINLDPQGQLSRFIDEILPELEGQEFKGWGRFSCEGAIGADGVWQNQQDQRIVVSPGEPFGGYSWFGKRLRLDNIQY